MSNRPAILVKKHPTIFSESVRAPERQVVPIGLAPRVSISQWSLSRLSRGYGHRPSASPETSPGQCFGSLAKSQDNPKTNTSRYLCKLLLARVPVPDRRANRRARPPSSRHLL